METTKTKLEQMIREGEEMLKEMNPVDITDQEENSKKRDEYIRSNTMKWLENGEKLRGRREKHRMSLRQVGELLGTSATRIRRLETGEPVSMAEHLTKCYNLLFDHLELHAALLDIQNNHKWRF